MNYQQSQLSLHEFKQLDQEGMSNYLYENIAGKDIFKFILENSKENDFYKYLTKLAIVRRPIFIEEKDFQKLVEHTDDSILRLYLKQRVHMHNVGLHPIQPYEYQQLDKENKKNIIPNEHMVQQWLQQGRHEEIFEIIKNNVNKVRYSELLNMANQFEPEKKEELLSAVDWNNNPYFHEMLNKCDSIQQACDLVRSVFGEDVRAPLKQIPVALTSNTTDLIKFIEEYCVLLIDNIQDIEQSAHLFGWDGFIDAARQQKPWIRLNLNENLTDVLYESLTREYDELTEFLLELADKEHRLTEISYQFMNDYYDQYAPLINCLNEKFGSYYVQKKVYLPEEDSIILILAVSNDISPLLKIPDVRLHYLILKSILNTSRLSRHTRWVCDHINEFLVNNHELYNMIVQCEENTNKWRNMAVLTSLKKRLTMY